LKNFFGNIKTVLIILLILVILLLSYCSSNSIQLPWKRWKTPSPIDTPVVVRVETKWDTVTKEIPVYIPEWKVRTEYKDTFIYKNIDTSEILKDYFASYSYFDTLYNDSITIRIKDTITQNKIKSRSIEYDLLIPTTIITRDSIVRKRKFYLGIGASGTTSQLTNVSGEILYTGRKKIGIGVGLGLNQDFNVILSGKMYWKLGK
tara:strand:+ start:128 stop:739 length:612 start_codon:yes stop_codon:yes gene_type:complete